MDRIEALEVDCMRKKSSPDLIFNTGEPNRVQLINQIILLFFLSLQRLFCAEKVFLFRHKQTKPSFVIIPMNVLAGSCWSRSINCRSTSNAVLFTVWINSSTWLLNVRKIFALKIIFLLQSTLHHLMHYVPNLLVYCNDL